MRQRVAGENLVFDGPVFLEVLLDEVGHALVVRNGVTEPRTVTTAAGALEIQAPRVHDRREGRRFTSAILPPWARRSPKVTEVLPVLYLRGISTKDFEPALAEFFGSEAGLSASTIQRLTREWGEQLAAFRQRDLSQVDYVYLWADGVHFNIRLDHERLFRTAVAAMPAGLSTRQPSFGLVLKGLATAFAR